VNRDACYTTQPVELLNPDNILRFGLDYGSVPKTPRTPGGSLPAYAFPADQTQTDTQSEAGMSDADTLEHHENGQFYAGTPNSVSNGDINKFGRRTSFDTQDGDTHSIADSEGTVSIKFPSSESPFGLCKSLIIGRPS
jgi:hypothetical protein